MYRIGFLFLVCGRLLALGFLGLGGYHLYTARAAGLPVVPEHFASPESTIGLLFGVVFTGMLIAWFRERMGGWIIVFGMTSIYVSEFLWSKGFPTDEIYLVMFGTGFLFILASSIIGGSGD